MYSKYKKMEEENEKKRLNAASKQDGTQIQENFEQDTAKLKQEMTDTKEQHESSKYDFYMAKTAKDDVEAEMEKLKQDNERLKRHLDEKAKECERLTQEFNNKATTANNDIQHVQAERKKLTQENEHLKQQLNDKGKECERLKQANETVNGDTLVEARSQLRKTRRNPKDVNLDYDSKSETQIKELEGKLHVANEQIKKMESEYERIQNELLKVKMESDKLTLVHEKIIVDFEESSGTAINDILKKEVESLKEQIKQQKIKETEMKSDIDHLRLSLSKVAGEKMLDGNPMITDLSDSNRPQKLSEKFNSLYDNSWTDAYEMVANEIDDEKVVCTRLLAILKNCWEFCRNFSDKQLDTLKLFFISSEIKDEDKQTHLEQFPSKHSKLIQDTRRCFSQRFIPNLYQHFWQSSENNQLEASVKPYVEACLELCWHSAISDPPLAYDFTAENIDDFRGYTKSGDTIDYVVWPSMYLYTHGPLLYKGVVQFNPETN